MKTKTKKKKTQNGKNEKVRWRKMRSEGKQRGNFDVCFQV